MVQYFGDGVLIYDQREPFPADGSVRGNPGKEYDTRAIVTAIETKNPCLSGGLMREVISTLRLLMGAVAEQLPKIRHRIVHNIRPATT